MTFLKQLNWPDSAAVGHKVHCVPADLDTTSSCSEAEGRTPHTTNLVIEAGRTEQQYWRDLWSYRELFYFLAWRDLLVRYKQTFVGVSWSLIRPLLTTIVLIVVFGKQGQCAPRQALLRCLFSLLSVAGRRVQWEIALL